MPCPYYQTKDLPDPEACRENRRGYRVMNGKAFKACAGCGRVLPAKKDMGGKGKGSLAEKTPIIAGGCGMRPLASVTSDPPPARNCTGEEDASIARSDGRLKPIKTRGPLSNRGVAESGGVPHKRGAATVRPTEQEGRATGKDAPRLPKRGPGKPPKCKCSSCKIRECPFREGREPHAPQPMPVSGSVEVLPLVIADLQKRSEAGVKKYGTLLKTCNGRDAMIDAYQEILDAAMYLRQRIEENRGGRLPGYTRQERVRRGWPKGKPRKVAEVRA